jgi:glycosyltransferase involved in cell wall biosynthesis
MFQKRNIGIVANTAFNIFNFRLELIKSLQKEGYVVFAIAPHDKYVDFLKQNNIEFIELTKLTRKGTNPIYDIQLINELKKIYKQYKLDVVLQYTIKPNIYGTLAAKLTTTKTICTVTGLGYTFLNKNLISKIAHRLYQFAFYFADKVLFQNSDDLKIFLDLGLVNKNKTAIIPGSGIDVVKFHPDFCIKKITDFTDEPTRFLFIGRLLIDKGINEYAEAAKIVLQKFPTTEFHVLGEIDQQNPSAIKKQTLESWIENKYIVYHAHAHDTRPYICAADCVVLPSYREGMPRVILEAMAMGKPCITSDAPGCKDAVEIDKTGFICKTADATDLAQVLLTFITLKYPYKKQLGINARLRAENIFSTSIINAKYLEYLLDLC